MLSIMICQINHTASYILNPCTQHQHLTFGANYNENSMYPNFPKFSDRQLWANSGDPDQTPSISDQGLHGLPFRLHRLDSLLYGRAT